MPESGPIAAIRSSVLMKMLAPNIGVVLGINIVQFGVVFFVFSTEITQSPSWGAQMVVVVVSLVILTAVWMIAFVLAGRNALKPLPGIVESVQAACEGEIGHKVEVDTDDEFGDAGAAATTRCSTSSST